MDIRELEKELQQALSNYGHDVQEELLSDDRMNRQDENDRKFLEMIDEMNRHNYYVLNEFKNSLIKYLEANKGGK